VNIVARWKRRKLCGVGSAVRFLTAHVRRQDYRVCHTCLLGQERLGRAVLRWLLVCCRELSPDPVKLAVYCDLVHGHGFTKSGAWVLYMPRAIAQTANGFAPKETGPRSRRPWPSLLPMSIAIGMPKGHSDLHRPRFQQRPILPFPRSNQFIGGVAKSGETGLHMLDNHTVIVSTG
jgi:hypothetical protein